MTLTEIRNSDRAFLNAGDISDVLQCHPYSINIQAKEDPAKLGFPVSIIGALGRLTGRKGSRGRRRRSPRGR